MKGTEGNVAGNDGIQMSESTGRPVSLYCCSLKMMSVEMGG